MQNSNTAVCFPEVNGASGRCTPARRAASRGQQSGSCTHSDCEDSFSSGSCPIVASNRRKRRHCQASWVLRLLFFFLPPNPSAPPPTTLRAALTHLGWCRRAWVSTWTWLDMQLRQANWRLQCSSTTSRCYFNSPPLTASSPLLFDCPPPEGAGGEVPSIIPGVFYLLVVAAGPVCHIQFVADFEVAPRLMYMHTI